MSSAVNNISCVFSNYLKHAESGTGVRRSVSVSFLGSRVGEELALQHKLCSDMDEGELDELITR